ncbi:hypothetical protein N7499_000835 [Penicillium canescens]|uniref:Uncharacterized protein n=1 Tax=Penicillium canescens TaxID=5083 RepID=A0AAD6IHK5_PENCN|nr:uncharacterized protein N7446_010960 [Penicillium canescens]KAJ6007171.1 hypothetical protein N7522_005522 [Penicillium canescens]KAJ6029688.1 hypothetical protein N7444_012675 [Penicillium canescens]KAJ6048120.1 hypothetical protein N7460_004267 [Penicillium canescens]KAJ6048277.1 hypothetical protein N7446_010960 [Penicillium canescens]KAJ6101205.1 hypothetical protein N7499_000835 [Penicillium canescens]
MNYQRAINEIPAVFQVSSGERGSNILNSFLGWVRNETFGNMAEVCALWAAIVDANEHLTKLDQTLTSHEIPHAEYKIKEILDSELREAKELMALMPGGPENKAINTDDDLIHAIGRLKFLRHFNQQK